MNDGGKRRYTDEAILTAFENPQRLHARPSDELVIGRMSPICTATYRVRQK